MTQHTLVVGGTGMLAGLCETLHQQGHLLTILSRSERRFAHLARGRSGFHHLALDYTDASALCEGLQAALAERGPISLAVCWVHSTAPHGLTNICEELLKAVESLEVVHVVGSAWANPARLLSPLEKQLRSLSSLRYKQAILGFQLVGETSRWLTDEEISAGVWEAVQSEQDTTIVGVVKPWSRRP